MSFHYSRSPGAHGGVARVEGSPAGVRLDRLLAKGLPPVRIGLELVAALCELLHIAHEDGHTHGDVTSAAVWIAGDGVIALAGFGESRGETSAPERIPRGPATDLYGLGRVASELLCPYASRLDEAPQDGAPAHDTAVNDFVTRADLGDLDAAMATDVRSFLVYLMSFDRRERPEALHAWRSFIAFARSHPGPELEPWAADALAGTAAHRVLPPPPSDEEDLAGPVAASGPLSQAMNLRPSAKGGRTLYWDKDDLPEEAPPVPPAFSPELPAKPAVGGGRATRHWSEAELAAMARGDASAPRPHRHDVDPPPAPAKPVAPSVPPPPPAFGRSMSPAAPKPPTYAPPQPSPLDAPPPPVASAPEPAVAPEPPPVAIASPAPPKSPVATFRQPGAPVPKPAAKQGVSTRTLVLIGVGVIALLSFMTIVLTAVLWFLFL